MHRFGAVSASDLRPSSESDTLNRPVPSCSDAGVGRVSVLALSSPCQHSRSRLHRKWSRRRRPVCSQRIFLDLTRAGLALRSQRALANHPPVILADEPTAPLDSERALTVIHLLNRMAQQYETAIIVVTHDAKIIPTFRRIYHIRDGVAHEEAGAAAQATG